MTQTVAALPAVTEADRARIVAAPRTSAAHQELFASLPAMATVELGGAGRTGSLPATFTAAAWNLERCLFPEDSAAHLAAHGPKVVLLSEMDSGMARTGQRNTTAEMARALGMYYAYAVEFYEMGLGGPTEQPFCVDNFNTAGWHGNGILSAVPFQRVALIRLDDAGLWFASDAGGAGDPEQPRIGGRMAVAAELATEAGPICVVSTHLESSADAAYRHAQFETLLAGIDGFAPDMPVLIGGDLNTGNHVPPDYDWRVETLFDLARQHGYGWDLTPEGVTTRSSLITPHNTRRMKLDWFCVRGLDGSPGPLLPSLGPGDRPLSDHECILCRLAL